MRILAVGIALLMWAPLSRAAGDEPAATAATRPAARRPLVVGVKVTPPFVMRNAAGRWSGISVDLWRRVAAGLGLRYRFKESDLDGLLRGVRRGTIDVAVAALTVTAERERQVDFAHPYYSTGLGIAVPASRQTVWLGLLERFFSWRFLKVVLALAGVLLVAGALVWLFERRRNPEQFGGKARSGLAAGFWWSAVTMTTVGYGDKAPRSLGGRVVALIWMFGSIIIISSFTAAIASSLTVSSLESPVRGPGDLPRVRVSSVRSATGGQYLDRHGVRFQAAGSVDAALDAVARRRADAAVYDAPLLRYLVKSKHQGELVVLPRTFSRQDYAFALPSGSALREPLNRALLGELTSPWWQALLTRHLGE